MKVRLVPLEKALRTALEGEITDQALWESSLGLTSDILPVILAPTMSIGPRPGCPATMRTRR